MAFGRAGAVKRSALGIYLLCAACAHRTPPIAFPCQAAAVERPFVHLYMERVEIWDFAERRSRHVFYLASDPRSDVMGRIYFRACRAELAWNYATQFATAAEAIESARREGYDVVVPPATEGK